MAGNNNCATQLLHMEYLNDSAIGLIRNLYSLTSLGQTFPGQARTWRCGGAGEWECVPLILWE